MDWPLDTHERPYDTDRRAKTIILLFYVPEFDVWHQRVTFVPLSHHPIRCVPEPGPSLCMPGSVRFGWTHMSETYIHQHTQQPIRRIRHNYRWCQRRLPRCRTHSTHQQSIRRTPPIRAQYFTVVFTRRWSHCTKFKVRLLTCEIGAMRAITSLCLLCTHTHERQVCANTVKIYMHIQCSSSHSYINQIFMVCH